MNVKCFLSREEVKFLVCKYIMENVFIKEESSYKINSENVFLYFNKNDLDTELFTINKKITVHHIPRYQHFNGDYLLSRKRELYFREDTSFEMISMINLHKI